MIELKSVEAYGGHRAMTIVAYVAKRISTLTVNTGVTIGSVQQFDGTPCSPQQLHAALHRVRPASWSLNARIVSDGVYVHRGQ